MLKLLVSIILPKSWWFQRQICTSIDGVVNDATVEEPVVLESVVIGRVSVVDRASVVGGASVVDNICEVSGHA